VNSNLKEIEPEKRLELVLYAGYASNLYAALIGAG
jgi:hypothetical protein